MLGSVLTRFRRAKISYPGGCDIGLRPIDLHLSGLKRLGVQITEDGGYIDCVADKLTGADKTGGTELNRGKKAYKSAVLEPRVENASYVTSGENDKEILERLKAIVSAEEPISYEFLVRRCLTSLGITKYGTKVDARMQALIALCGFKYEKILGYSFYRKTDKCVGFEKYRVETADALRKYEYDYTPYEIVALIRGALEDKVALYMDEIVTIVSSIMRIARPGDKFATYVNDCVSYGEEQGLFVRSVSDRISLA